MAVTLPLHHSEYETRQRRWRRRRFHSRARLRSSTSRHRWRRWRRCRRRRRRWPRRWSGRTGRRRKRRSGDGIVGTGDDGGDVGARRRDGGRGSGRPALRFRFHDGVDAKTKTKSGKGKIGGNLRRTRYPSPNGHLSQMTADGRQRRHLNWPLYLCLLRAERCRRAKGSPFANSVACTCVSCVVGGKALLYYYILAE